MKVVRFYGRDVRSYEDAMREVRYAARYLTYHQTKWENLRRLDCFFPEKTIDEPEKPIGVKND